MKTNPRISVLLAQAYAFGQELESDETTVKNVKKVLVSNQQATMIDTDARTIFMINMESSLLFYRMKNYSVLFFSFFYFSFA